MVIGIRIIQMAREAQFIELLIEVDGSKMENRLVIIVI